jgi:hypothetical protein
MSQSSTVYTTLADVKNALQIEDTLDDTAIQAAILTASRQIDEYCQRFFYQEGTQASPATRYYTAYSPWYVETDDIVQITQLACDPDFDQSYAQIWNTTSAPLDVMYEPVNNPNKGWPWTRILAIGSYVFPYFFPQTVRVQGIFGFPEVPYEVELACKIQASRLFVRKQSPFGIAGSVELGTVRLNSRLDPDVEMLLKTFRRNKGLAY